MSYKKANFNWSIILILSIVFLLTFGISLVSSAVVIDYVEKYNAGDSTSECEENCTTCWENTEDYGSIKIEPLEVGNYDPIEIISVDNENSDNIFKFEWKSSKPVYCVLIKAGTQGFVYSYCDEGGSYGDTIDIEGEAPQDRAISHVSFCYGEGEEKLSVNKTVNTSYNRTHDWSIEKTVTTSEGEDDEIILEEQPLDAAIDTETATWNIHVTYEGYEDSDFIVSGEITITNDGDLDAVITDVEDLMCGTDVELIVKESEEVFEGNYTLVPDEELILTYSLDVDEKESGCSNVVTVTTERDIYTDSVAIEESDWGDPDTEDCEDVDIFDDSDFLADGSLGSVSAGDYSMGETKLFYTYEESFEWSEDDCSGEFTDYVNTAEVKYGEETLDFDDATLQVKVLCEDLNVTKTVNTSYTRTYNWDIDKAVTTENKYLEDGEPKIWLYIDSTGNETATWNIEVSYLGYDDSNFKVEWEITIENTGDLEAEIVSVVDELCGTEIQLVWPSEFSEILAVGEILILTYSEDVDEMLQDCSNEVTVTTGRAIYSDEVDVTWDAPPLEINKVVEIMDAGVSLGTVTLDDLDENDKKIFSYEELFTWEEYGNNCGHQEYENTATIVETEQSASAILKVNVQCYIDETAYAMGESAVCFLDYQFSQWGWTNLIVPSENEYVWPLYTGAAFCDPDKGEYVGTVIVEYADGEIEYTFNLDWPYEIEEYHIYAGKDMFPQQTRGKKTIDTVAPGQYYIEDDLSGDIYVIIHAVVKMPDPNFGPDQ